MTLTCAHTHTHARTYTRRYLKRCKQLQTLVIMDGALVTLDEVVTLRRQLPHCNVIFDRNEPARGKFEKLQGGGIGDSQM